MRKRPVRRNRRTRPWAALLVCAAALVCLSCGRAASSPGEADTGAASVETAPAAELPTHEANDGSVETTAPGHTAYNPVGLRDPFKSFIVEQKAIEEKKERRPKTYLETLDISQLDVIALIVSEQGNWAMVRDAKGIGYVIKKGTPIGLDGGVVDRITSEEIIIHSEYRDFKGGVKKREISKRMKSP